MNKIKYSIIIPVHEITNEVMLKNCINAIARHSKFGDYEIILIGNGIKGHLLDTLLNLVNGYSNVRQFCNSANIGVYKSFNQGAKKSNGEYLVFLHADTLITEYNWLNLILKQLEENNAIAGGTVGVKLVKDLKLRKFVFFRHTLENDFNYLESWCYIIKRDIFDLVGRFDEQFSYMYGGEIDLSFRLELNGYKQIILKKLNIKHLGFDTARRQKEFNGEILKEKNLKLLFNKYNGAFPNEKPIAERILFKMENGELGDKLVALGILYEIKQKNPDSLIDVYLSSERYKDNNGYASLFKDLADRIFLKEREFNEKIYKKIYNISATGIHQEELDSSLNNEIQISRYQRWAKKCGFVYKGQTPKFYEVKEQDGILIKNELLKLKRPLIGISPFTSNTTKDWESSKTNIEFSKWQSLINMIHDSGGTCIILHYQRLLYKNTTPFDLSLKELGYLISKLDLLIGTESGNTHYAGILKIPMMVLLGSSSPLVLRHYNNVRILHKGECSNCNRFITPKFSGNLCGTIIDIPYSKCLTSISSDEVYKELCIFKGQEFNKKYQTKFYHV